MVAVYLIPLYILGCLYLLRWLILWLGACHGFLKKTWVRVIIFIIYGFFSLSLGFAFILPAGSLKRLMSQIGNYWLGTLLYVMLIIIAADALRLILRHIRQIDQHKLRSRKSFVCGGAVCLLLIAAVSIWGVINARIIHVTPYEITIQKDGGKFDELNIVLAADLHLGYNIGCLQMRNMVEKINAETPDLVVLAGDIFDNDYDALDDPAQLAEILRGIESKYGVYAVYGNHDIQEPILAGFTFGSEHKKMSDERMDALLADAGITLLRDEYVLIEDSVYLYGRPDIDRPGRGIDTRKTPEQMMSGMDLSKPVLVIDHAPKQLAELSAAGADVDFSGHTHDGQMFPGNLIMPFLWENPCGYLNKDGMHSIVTSGVGLFGPNMRVGTKAEVCRVKVMFGK